MKSAINNRQGRAIFFSLTLLLILSTACSGGGEDRAGGPGGGSHGGPGRGGMPGGMPFGGGEEMAAAVPVEVARVARRSISSFIETNGTLEAEYEVDLVARTAGPIVDLLAEEGDLVGKGQVLARIDEQELRAQFEISRVEREEARLAFQRAESLQDESLISSEAFDQARSDFESAQARFDGSRIQLAYTEIRAPFGGLIVQRYVDMAQTVTNNMPLFRISDFTPLLCPIQVPERELSQLHGEQTAFLTVESFPGRRFEAEVLRISPVVDAATGTIKVTLNVHGQDRLRPGMFARVFLETETRDGTLVIPKSALALESIGDTVYVADGETASRREVELGFTEGDFVEILSGLDEGEPVVVVGQDGLSDGTPIQVLDPAGAPRMADEQPDADGAPQARPASGHGPGGGGRMDISKATPEQLERIKGFMRARGMTEEQIEQRIKQAREPSAGEPPASPSTP